MAVTIDDFAKIWASTSPLTPYSFSESQYKEGWNFVGGTPPSRQMWDAFMQGADEKLKYLYQHEDVPVGFEYFTMNPNIPQGSLPLLGGEYSRETYADLWSWVQEQTGYLKTESEWQALSTSNNGNVPFYSDGDGSTTFRVPSLKCWVKGANGTVSEVGSYLAAGLPNITGSTTSGATYFGTGGTGAMYGTNTGSLPNVQTSGSATYANMQNFDASRSNSIYGNANTVVPESIVGMWLVKAYGVIVDTGTIDEQAYIDDRFNASKQYTDDSVTGLKNTYLPANYLPLSGGTLTGALIFADSGSFNLIQRATNGKHLAVLGGNDYSKCASISLAGGSENSGTTYQGSFSVRASKDDGTYKILFGSPDGTLTWDGQPIQTSSDKRLKQDFSDVPADVLEAWGKVEWKQFKYKADVERKGDSCRFHTGLVAQDVKEVGEENHVDLLKYGILCHDVREATEDSEAVDLWTVRYEEALAMEVIYLRNEIKKLREEIKALRTE